MFKLPLAVDQPHGGVDVLRHRVVIDDFACGGSVDDPVVYCAVLQAGDVTIDGGHSNVSLGDRVARTPERKAIVEAALRFGPHVVELFAGRVLDKAGVARIWWRLIRFEAGFPERLVTVDDLALEIGLLRSRRGGRG